MDESAWKGRRKLLLAITCPQSYTSSGSGSGSSSSSSRSRDNVRMSLLRSAAARISSMALLAPRTSLYTPSLAHSSLVQPWRTGGSYRPISVTPRTYTGPESWTWDDIEILERSTANLMQWFHTEESRGPRQGQGTLSRGRMGGL